MSSPADTSPDPSRRWWASLELVRLPNLFTAVADVLMGVLFVRAIAGAADACMLGLLVVASTLLYASGVVLNDLFDYQRDLAERPDRPLPSGRLSRQFARRLGTALLTAGVAIALPAAWLAGDFRPAVAAGALAACILLYDVWLKRTLLGPPAMGACRMFNVLLGMSVAGSPWQSQHWLVAGAVGIYITGVTWFARNEVCPGGRLQLALATGVLLSGIALLARLPDHAADRLVPVLKQQPERWRLMMLFLGVLIGWRCLRAVLNPVPARVQTAVKLCILSLVVLDAAACYAVRGTSWAVAILLLLAPAVVLGQWIRST
ncbi:MAG: UbiA family prenyltransferase [Pirellulales bacterium]|nr:UbiA family prenyltransferase [Pirellulales bacterium]